MTKKQKKPTFHTIRHPYSKISLLLFVLAQVYTIAILVSQKLFNNQIITTTIVTPLAAVILIISFHYYRKLHEHVARYEKAKIAMYSKGLIGLFAVLALSIALPFFFEPVVQPNQEALTNSFADSAVPMAIYIVLIAPITEELIFREFLPSVFYYKKSIYIVTAILFTLLHLPNGLEGLLIYGSLSALFTYLRYAGGNIRYNLIMHIAWNTFGLIIMILSQTTT